VLSQMRVRARNTSSLELVGDVRINADAHLSRFWPSYAIGYDDTQASMSKRVSREQAGLRSCDRHSTTTLPVC